MSCIVPHSTRIFGAVSLCLRAGGVPSHDPRLDWEVNLDDSFAYLGKVGAYLRDDEAKAAFPRPLELRIVGSEPFRHPDALQAIVACAKDNGMVSHIWTTGEWIADDGRYEEILDGLGGLVHAITLHLSDGATQRVPLARLDALIRFLRTRALGLVIECAIGPASVLPLELFGLEIVNSDSAFIRIVPDRSEPADGDQTDGPGDGYFLSAPQRFDRCAERFALVIEPGGDVYPCLGGAGVASLRLGNLATDSVRDIVARVGGDDRLLRLRNEGPAHLADQARSLGEWTDGRFSNACQLHRRVLAASSRAAGERSHPI